MSQELGSAVLFEAEGQSLLEQRPPTARRGALRRTGPDGIYVRWGVKRGIDIVCALAGLVFLAPAFLVIALVLLWQDGFPLLFSHRRIGRGGRIFHCLKFRSMARDADRRLEELLASDEKARREWEADHKLVDDPRIHPVGDVLRRTSLDELPQLINILRGDMTVVGPRPIVTAEVARYGDDYAAYASVRPGLTGLWQVSGRNDISYASRVALDADYVRRCSFLLDLRIILKTIVVVFTGTGR